MLIRILLLAIVVLVFWSSSEAKTNPIHVMHLIYENGKLLASKTWKEDILRDYQ